MVGSANFGSPSRQGLVVVSFDLTDGGSVDTSFNDGGVALIQLGDFASNGKAALALAENAVGIAETRATSANWSDIAAVSLQPDSGVDSSFGTGGIARTQF